MTFFKEKNNIWPRGLPLDEINSTKILISKKKLNKNFFLQQGVFEKKSGCRCIIVKILFGLKKFFH